MNILPNITRYPSSPHHVCVRAPDQVSPEEMRKMKATTVKTKNDKAMESKRKKVLKELDEEEAELKSLIRVGESLRKNADLAERKKKEQDMSKNENPRKKDDGTKEVDVAEPKGKAKKHDKAETPKEPSGPKQPEASSAAPAKKKDKAQAEPKEPQPAPKNDAGVKNGKKDAQTQDANKTKKSKAETPKEPSGPKEPEASSAALAKKKDKTQQAEPKEPQPAPKKDEGVKKRKDDARTEDANKTKKSKAETPKEPSTAEEPQATSAAPTAHVPVNNKATPGGANNEVKDKLKRSNQLDTGLGPNEAKKRKTGGPKDSQLAIEDKKEQANAASAPIIAGDKKSKKTTNELSPKEHVFNKDSGWGDYSFGDVHLVFYYVKLRLFSIFLFPGSILKHMDIKPKMQLLKFGDRFGSPW